MCRCCTEKCAKWSTLSLSVVVFTIGLILAILWGRLFQNILNYELSVSNTHTKGFKMWKETPIPMYFEVYFFNWTNPDRVEKYETVKPSFTEIGPYTFSEHHVRENITFNDNNDTLTYLNKRTWKFCRDKSVGDLDDEMTVLNPIPILIANRVKDEHYLVKRAVNFFLEEKGEGISVVKPVRELLFEGYNDTLINIALKLNISGFKLPFKRFGWFVDRNDSAPYDGVFNMYTGKDDLTKLGVIPEWNYQHKTSYFEGDCGIVNGTSGELWYPPGDFEEISIFASDLCSSVNLHRNGTYTLYGIEGYQYEAGPDVFDNGTYFKKSKCFASNMPRGVRDVSRCKFDAPAYISFPHFYLSDPLYLENVQGMNPDPDKHTTKISLEPKMGLPLEVYAAFQLNLLMTQTEGINILSKVKTTLMPCFWFVQKAELSQELSSMAKLLLVAHKLGTYTGYGLIGIGILLFGAFIFILFRHRWKCDDDESLLSN